MTNIILIIGASSDIGIGLIKSINENCLILAHCNGSCESLIKVSGEISNKLVTLKANLLSKHETEEMLDFIEKNYGTPNKIVNLAALRVRNIRFKNVVWEDFEEDILVGLRSSIVVLKKFLPKLAILKNGKVVIMLSSYVIGVPPKSLSHYTVSKYAMLGLMKSLASEYADKNIQINSVSPSMIETKFLNNINEKLVEISAYNNPLKRNANIDDVVPVIKMLLSKESDYINGVNIPITGGSNF